MPIVVNGDYNYNYQKVLTKFVISIQSIYDINPKLIENWLRMTEFPDKLQELDKKCYSSEIMNSDNPILKKLLEVANHESFVETYMPWERESCGQILEEFSNGYIKYCNKHQYLHKITTKDDSEIDHKFVEKSAKDIIDEKIFGLRFNLYVKYIRLLSQQLVDEFIKSFSNYNQYLVEERDFNQLLDWLKNNPTDFKEKRVILKLQSKFVKIYVKNDNLPAFTLHKVE